jgi:hypothetical protein
MSDKKLNVKIIIKILDLHNIWLYIVQCKKSIKLNSFTKW